MKADGDAVLASSAAQALAVTGVRAGQRFDATDWLADEVPVALEFNGISHAVMLATPTDLDDFAIGFSLSEGILASRHELFDVEHEEGHAGITIRMRISSASFARLKDRRRSLAGRTGCGLCGTESLDHVVRDLPVMAAGPAYGALAISRAMQQLGALQPLQQATGAVHAAAWCTPDGNAALLREDVGRHNALDKLVGALARDASIAASTGFIAVTSRASFEMVQKTAVAGVPLLAAVSAATSLAAATADRCGLTLVGFARQNDLVVYAHADRLVW